MMHSSAMYMMLYGAAMPKAKPAVKPHPLHTPLFLANCKIDGQVPGKRRTGRSTAQALKLVSEAIQSPGKVFKIEDHHGTGASNRYLCGICRQVVENLGFIGFTFTDDTIKFG